MIVCNCSNVNEESIKDLTKQGLRLAEIRDMLQIGMGCGKCITQTTEIYEAAIKQGLADE